MDYVRTTPHCGQSCWRMKNGKVRHFHPGKKSHFRRRPCKDDCCRTPNRLERRRLKVRLREEAW